MLALASLNGGALVWTAVGGGLWGLGTLARKIGVAQRSDAQLHELAVLTALAYSLGNIIVPAFDFFNTDAASRQKILSDGKWQGTLPWLILAAISSSAAGMIAIYALGRATRHTSCLVALVENGVYCIASAVLIIVLLRESPSAWEYCAMALLTAGILLISSASPPTQDVAATSKKTDVEAGDKGQSRYGATQTGESTASDEASIMAYIFASLAGILWSLGMLGKRNSAGALPHDLERPGSAVTYMTYQIAGLPVIFFYWCYLSALGSLPLHITKDWFMTQGPKVLPLAMLSGVGGSLVTYGFAMGGKNGALLSLLADGIYTFIGSSLIAAVYGEHPSARQIIGGACILAAVVLPRLTQVRTQE